LASNYKTIRDIQQILLSCCEDDSMNSFTRGQTFETLSFILSLSLGLDTDFIQRFIQLCEQQIMYRKSCSVSDERLLASRIKSWLLCFTFKKDITMFSINDHYTLWANIQRTLLLDDLPEELAFHIGEMALIMLEAEVQY
jgi:hypothetical protein